MSKVRHRVQHRSRFSAEKRAFFVGILGEARVKQMEEELARLGKTWESQGMAVGFKSPIEIIEEKLMVAIEKKDKPPGRKHVDDLIAMQHQHEAGEGSKAGKAIRESTGHPFFDAASPYVGDLLDGKVVQRN